MNVTHRHAVGIAQFALALSLGLASAALAEERRIEATRIETSPGSDSTALAGPRSLGDGPKQSVTGDPKPSAGSGLPVHFGLLLSPVSIPRPLNGELFLRFFDVVGVGVGYSDFPNFIADPLLKLVKAASSGTTARLDQFDAWDVDVRVFPFFGSFFVGSSFGKQTLKGAVTQSTPTGAQTATVDSSATYATPRLGFLSTVGPGFTYGFDAGVQLKLSGTSKVTVPPGSSPTVQSAANSLADVGSSYPLPSLNFRLGWMY